MFDLKIIAGLVLALALTGWGAWKYHIFMNEKVTALTVELEQQKREREQVEEQLTTFKNDFEAMQTAMAEFQADVTRIQRENSDLRRRISALTAPSAAGANREEAQQNFDRLRAEMATSWEGIQ